MINIYIYISTVYKNEVRIFIPVLSRSERQATEARGEDLLAQTISQQILWPHLARFNVGPPWGMELMRWGNDW